MNEQASNLSFECPAPEITPYLDGELSPAGEAALETHLLGCDKCRQELNDQKTFLLALAESLESEPEFDLPEGFTKSIVTKAESGVSGLRVRNERVTAVVIVSLLFLFVVIVLGSEAANAFAPAASVLEQVGSVLGVAAHLTFNVAYGATVVLRSVLTSVAFGGPAVYLFGAVAFAIFAYVISRQFRRYFRT